MQSILEASDFFKNNQVIVRSNTTYDDGSEAYKSDHTVALYLFHEGFYKEGDKITSNDIGLLKVKEPFTGVYEKTISINVRPGMGSKARFEFMPL
ncbi:hypothetical protein ILUMI_14235 [Ignelater luminosus]|uniref:Uncharacterized protein n=1 Tax=Ignelater luminosus TaxID=2038154 RepID=A0A8K0CQT4_IGNLU|nr:hypothetical protein ILUMI_14235 [Ignelater luminosus]